MSEKFKIKLMELTTFILIIICIFAVYKLYTKPVSLNNVINNGSIKSIFIRMIVNDTKDYEIPDEHDIKLDKDEDIDEFITILNKYKYSKIPRFYNDSIINDIRKKYDPLADLVLPHITLVFPFDSELTNKN